LLAIYVALNEFKNEEFLEIYSDSMYCINSVTVWYKNWEKNGWKNAKNEDVKNKEIIQKILELIEERNNNCFFYYVKAHRRPLKESDPDYENWYGNDRADLLAKKSII
jgi:ribonuclease HI